MRANLWLSYHWYCAVICNVQNIRTAKDDGESDEDMEGGTNVDHPSFTAEGSNEELLKPTKTATAASSLARGSDPEVAAVDQDKPKHFGQPDGQDYEIPASPMDDQRPTHQATTAKNSRGRLKKAAGRRTYPKDM